VPTRGEEDVVFSIFDAMGVRSPSQPDTLSVAPSREVEKKKTKRERGREREKEQEEKEAGLMSLGKSAGRAVVHSHTPPTHAQQTGSLPFSGVSSPQSFRVGGDAKLLADTQRVRERSDVSREIMESFLRSLPSRNDVAVNPYLESSLRVYQLISVVKSPMVLFLNPSPSPSLFSHSINLYLLNVLLNIFTSLLTPPFIPIANNFRHFKVNESISLYLSWRTSGSPSLLLSFHLSQYLPWSNSLTASLFLC
jgi:hypothetical protein